MESSDARILRGAAIPTAVAGVVAAVIGLLAAGPKGLLGAAFGVVVVLVFFGISVLVVARISRQLLMQAALLSYAVKLIVLFGLIIAVKNVGFMDPKAFAWTVIGLTLVWIMAETRVTLSIREPYVQPFSDSTTRPKEADPADDRSH